MKHDFYQTIDPAAFPPLLARLPAEGTFLEPCAGEGKLIAFLEDAGHRCVGAWDVKLYRKRTTEVKRGDATRLILPRGVAQRVITNPPWTRELLHAIIFNLYWQMECWFLMAASWAYTDQARPFMPLCRAIAPTPRLQWISGTKHDSEDDCAWYCFAPPAGAQTIFHSRL